MRKLFITVATLIPLLAASSGFAYDISQLPPEVTSPQEEQPKNHWSLLLALQASVAMPVCGQERSGQRGDLANYRGIPISISAGAQWKNLRLYAEQKIMIQTRLESNPDPEPSNDHNPFDNWNDTTREEREGYDFKALKPINAAKDEALGADRNLGITGVRVEGVLPTSLMDGKFRLFAFGGPSVAYHFDYTHPSLWLEAGIGIEIDVIRLSFNMAYLYLNDDDPNDYDHLLYIAPTLGFIGVF